MAKLSKNFDSAEFRCKCGCGFDTPDKELISKLQRARDIYAKPMFITSGCRCPKHNKNVGGVSSSAHITGKAADIATPSGKERFLIIKALLEAGFTRIGINFSKNFVHVDVDSTKPSPTIFSY